MHAGGLVVNGLHACGVEADLGELLDVEEVWRAQVFVAPGFAGLDRGDLDRAVRSAVGQIRLQLERPLELGELAAHICDAHVLDRELDGRVPGIDDPSAVALVHRRLEELAIGAAG